MTKNLIRNQSFIIKNQINNISEENKKNKKIMVIAKQLKFFQNNYLNFRNKI